MVNAVNAPEPRNLVHQQVRYIGHQASKQEAENESDPGRNSQIWDQPKIDLMGVDCDTDYAKRHQRRGQDCERGQNHIRRPTVLAILSPSRSWHQQFRHAHGCDHAKESYELCGFAICRCPDVQTSHVHLLSFEYIDRTPVNIFGCGRTSQHLLITVWRQARPARHGGGADLSLQCVWLRTEKVPESENTRPGCGQRRRALALNQHRQT